MTKVGDKVILNAGMSVYGVREGVVSSISGDDIYIDVVVEHETVTAHRYPCEFTMTETEATTRGKLLGHSDFPHDPKLIVGDFIEWIKDSKFTICEYTLCDLTETGHKFHPTVETTEAILSKYFDEIVVEER